MSEIVDITSKLKAKKEAKLQDKYFDSHNYVLDACDEVFPGGAILIEICEDGGINLSSTILDDHETMVDALVSAALKIKDEMEKK